MIFRLLEFTFYLLFFYFIVVVQWSLIWSQSSWKCQFVKNDVAFSEAYLQPKQLGNILTHISSKLPNLIIQAREAIKEPSTLSTQLLNHNFWTHFWSN